MIVRVNVVLNRTVVDDSDWRFHNLYCSHLQSQSKLNHISWRYYTLVIVLIGSVIGRLSVKPWCYWLWRPVMSLVHFDLSIVTVKQSLILLLVKLPVVQSLSCSQFCLILSVRHLYGAGNCWLPFSGVCSKLVNLSLFNNWADIAKYSVKIIILSLLW